MRIIFWPDKLFGTEYAMTEVPRSKTVHNLGYDDAEAARLPWVRAISDRLKAEAQAEA